MPWSQYPEEYITTKYDVALMTLTVSVNTCHSRNVMTLQINSKQVVDAYVKRREDHSIWSCKLVFIGWNTNRILLGSFLSSRKNKKVPNKDAVLLQCISLYHHCGISKKQGIHFIGACSKRCAIGQTRQKQRQLHKQLSTLLMSKHISRAYFLGKYLPDFVQGITKLGGIFSHSCITVKR